MTKKEAFEILQENDELFIAIIEELHRWDGFLEEALYSMDELDDFYYNTPATSLIQDLNGDFDINDDYFFFDCYGLHSTNSQIDHYLNHTSYEEVFDNMISNASHIEIGYIDKEYQEFLDNIE
jgi:hypothetical protein